MMESLVDDFVFWEFLAVQWLGLCAFTARDPGSIAGGGTKSLLAAWYN